MGHINKTVFVFLWLFLNLCNAQSVSDFRPEPQCSYIGGLCTHISECSLELTYFREDFCPFQSYLGAICCGTVPELFMDCSRRDGECIPTNTCSENQMDTQATCQSGFTCCIRA